MKQFTSTARKDGRWWIVQCDQHPEALSQVARLDQAAKHQREAIAFVTDIDENEIHVAVHPLLNETITTELNKIRKTRTSLERQKTDLATAQTELAELLVKQQNMSLRDTGYTLGLSFQRVGQLVEKSTNQKTHTNAATSTQSPERKPAEAPRPNKQHQGRTGPGRTLL